VTVSESVAASFAEISRHRRDSAARHSSYGVGGGEKFEDGVRSHCLTHRLCALGKKTPVSRRSLRLVSRRAAASRALLELSSSGSRSLLGCAAGALGHDRRTGDLHQRGEGGSVVDGESAAPCGRP